MTKQELFEKLMDISDVCMSWADCADCPLCDNGDCMINGTPRFWDDSKFYNLLDVDDDEEDEETDD